MTGKRKVDVTGGLVLMTVRAELEFKGPVGQSVAHDQLTTCARRQKA